MDAYIYQADLWCEDCIEAIKRELAKPEHVNENDEGTYDSDEWPKGPFADGGGESDTPCHCAGCHVYLDNPLTSEGVEYALAAIEHEAEDLASANRIMPAKGTAEDTLAFAHWHGLPHKAIVLSWAESLRWYALDDEQEARLETAVAALEQEPTP